MPVKVEVTENFFANLDAIETFYLEYSEATAFPKLVSDLLETVLPNFELFPDMGRPFLARSASSTRGIRIQSQLLANYPGYMFREYLMAHHAVLYARGGDSLYVLGIKDFRQLSYDLTTLAES